MEIKIYDHVETDTLRHRETAQQLLQTINTSQEETVTLNFKAITFASRSFLHELLSNLEEKKLTYKNTNKEIKNTIKNSFTKPVLKLETPDKVKELSPIQHA